MAIVQISKIQQRAGNLVDLPQLDNAEFGWATDENRLFIGRTGITYADENIEVLTSYSNISFSQIDGSDGGNFNITAPLSSGQLLTYVSSTNTWENYKGTTAQLDGEKLELGNVSNISMTGGAIGYVLETDGLGNLSWTPKGTLYSNIIALSTATPIIMTVANTTPYTNGQSITITGANGVANANVNGLTFYLTLLANFASSGQVALYTDISRTIGANGTSLTYTNSPNAIATASLGGTGSGAVGGSNTTVQFNDQNISNGVAAFTFNKSTTTLTVSSGTIVTSTIGAASTVTSPRLISNIATGTAPLTVTSTTRVANLSVAYANVSDYEVVTTQTSGTFYPVFVSGSTTGNYAAASNTNLSFNAATGALSATLLTGTLTTTNQPNIANIGTLGNLNVTSNTTSGNFIGRLANGNSNVNIPAANGNVTVSVVGNANVIVVTGTGANITGTANISGNVSSANLISVNTTGAAFNIIGATQTTLNSAGGNINVTSGTGNGTGKGGATIIVAGNAQSSGNAAGGELQLSAGTGYGQGAGGNAGIYGGNSANASGAYGGNVVLTGGTYNGVGGNLVATAGAAYGTDKAGGITIISGGTGTGAGTPGNVAIQVSAALSTGTTTQTLANVVVVTGTGVNVAGTLNTGSGNANVGNLGTAQVLASANITAPQLISNVAIGTAPFVVTSTTQVANLNVASAGSATSSTNAAAVQTNTSTSSTVYLAGVTSSSNGNSALNIVSGISANMANNAISSTTFIGNLVGNVTTAAQGNITSLGSLTGLTVSNATGVVNLVTTANVSLGAVANVHITGGTANQILKTDGSGNLSWTDPNGGYYLHTQVSTATTWTVTHNLNRQYLTVEPIDSSGNSYTGRYDYPTINYTNANSFTMTFSSAVAGYAAVTGGGTNINSVSVGNSTPGGVNTQVQFNDDGNLAGSGSLVYNKNTGTLTANVFVSPLPDGTAPFIVSSSTRVANLNAATAGTVRTAAQPNITSVGTLTSLSVTGTTTSGNFATAGNITASYLVSNVATGTAPFVVTSTTQVANLSVETAGSATTAGTVTTAAQPNITSVGTLTSLAVTGNANINTGTPVAYDTTGAIITGRVLGRYANKSGNVSFYFADYNASNTITSADALVASKLGSVLDTTIGNSNISMAVGTNYGSKTAGIAFVSGTASDVTAIAAGTSTSYTGNINAVMLGYPTIGPRILIQDYALFDDSPNVITYIGTTHSFVGNITTSNNITANTVTGNLTTAAQPNISSVGTLTGLTLTNAAIISVGSNTNTGTFTGNFSLSAGSRLNATYADLAEYYEADNLYEPGTVLEFGGDKEVTIAEDGTTRVAGVVSTNPAYVMNSSCEGEYIVALALQGRVPCKVRGTIHKGDMLISGGDGFARSAAFPVMGTVIGKALENFDGEGVIEVAVGRL